MTKVRIDAKLTQQSFKNIITVRFLETTIGYTSLYKYEDDGIVDRIKGKHTLQGRLKQ